MGRLAGCVGICGQKFDDVDAHQREIVVRMESATSSMLVFRRKWRARARTPVTAFKLRVARCWDPDDGEKGDGGGGVLNGQGR